MPKIKNIKALKILDSRGQWTLKTTVILGDGTIGQASVPSGASVGKYEAKDGFVPVEKVVESINKEVGPKLLGMEPNQKKVDEFLIKLDGTPDKSILGVSQILPLSLAVCQAAAKSQGVPLYRYIDSLFEPQAENSALPTPLFNMINGGKHADNDLDFQEFMVAPSVELPFLQAIEAGVIIYHRLGKLLESGGFSTEVGDEGGLAPRGLTIGSALDFLVEAIKKSGFAPGKDVFLAIDAAASSFPPGVSYNEDFYRKLCTDYPLIYLEDPFSEDAWEDWTKLTKVLRGKINIVGDDLTVTNVARVRKAIEKRAITGVVIKPNQIGTLTETLAVVKEAKRANLLIVVSHRSGETESPFIADLAVGVGAEYIKAGAPARGERVVKYNRLLEIEKELKPNV